MARLLGKEINGNRVEKYWLHVGDDNRDKITVETVEDVEPVFDQVRFRAQSQSSKSGFRYKASLPFTLLDESAKTSAALWGVSVKDAFAEIMQQKTDRAKRVMKMMTEGRDFSKLQAKNYV